MPVARTYVYAAKDTRVIRFRKTVATSMNVRKQTKRLVVSTPFARISLEVMNVLVRLDSMAIHSTFAKNATVRSVSASHLTNWSEETVSWLTARMVINVRRALNVSPSLVE
jgi:hypothetical protein